jgi:transposase
VVSRHVPPDRARQGTGTVGRWRAAGCNTIERAIGRLKRYRAVATRFDKLAVCYEATIQVRILLDRTPDA